MNPIEVIITENSGAASRRYSIPPHPDRSDVQCASPGTSAEWLYRAVPQPTCGRPADDHCGARVPLSGQDRGCWKRGTRPYSIYSFWTNHPNQGSDRFIPDEVRHGNDLVRGAAPVWAKYELSQGGSNLRVCPDVDRLFRTYHPVDQTGEWKPSHHADWIPRLVTILTGGIGRRSFE